MNTLELVNSLQARLKGRLDPEAQHLSLRLARTAEEAELLEIQALIDKLPQPPQERVSPLKELRTNLINKIKKTLTVEQYEQLEAAISGERCDGETWQLLFSNVGSAPLPKITFPSVRGPSDKARSRSNLLLALLTKAAKARQDGVRLVAPDELRRAMEAKTDAPLQILLDRPVPRDE